MKNITNNEHKTNSFYFFLNNHFKFIDKLSDAPHISRGTPYHLTLLI